MVNRGEVWWAEHPEAGRRPYLVLSRQAAIPVLDRVLAIPATRTIRGIPTEVLLDEDDGMPESCALSFDNITTMPKALLTSRITRLSVDKLEETCRALAAATAC
jgi:mRNA interferase MazF